MSQWVCHTCKVEVEEVDDILIRYNDIDLPDASGYRCPQCGLELLSEELVKSELRDAEEMLEAK